MNIPLSKFKNEKLTIKKLQSTLANSLQHFSAVHLNEIGFAGAA